MTLSVTIHINCSVARCLIKRCLSHGMCLYQVITNDVANDEESTQKNRSLRQTLVVQRVNRLGKLINIIPGSCLSISSLPGSALRMHVESLERCQQEFSKPCMVNLVSKDTYP